MTERHDQQPQSRGGCWGLARYWAHRTVHQFIRRPADHEGACSRRPGDEPGPLARLYRARFARTGGLSGHRRVSDGDSGHQIQLRSGMEFLVGDRFRVLDRRGDGGDFRSARHPRDRRVFPDDHARSWAVRLGACLPMEFRDWRRQRNQSSWQARIWNPTCRRRHLLLRGVLFLCRVLGNALCPRSIAVRAKPRRNSRARGPNACSWI